MHILLLEEILKLQIWSFEKYDENVHNWSFQIFLWNSVCTLKNYLKSHISLFKEKLLSISTLGPLKKILKIPLKNIFRISHLVPHLILL